jgi:hypothetical protein
MFCMHIEYVIGILDKIVHKYDGIIGVLRAHSIHGRCFRWCVVHTCISVVGSLHAHSIHIIKASFHVFDCLHDISALENKKYRAFNRRA